MIAFKIFILVMFSLGVGTFLYLIVRGSFALADRWEEYIDKVRAYKDGFADASDAKCNVSSLIDYLDMLCEDDIAHTHALDFDDVAALRKAYKDGDWEQVIRYILKARNK